MGYNTDILHRRVNSLYKIERVQLFIVSLFLPEPINCPFYTSHPIYTFRTIKTLFAYSLNTNCNTLHRSQPRPNTNDDVLQ